MRRALPALPLLLLLLGCSSQAAGLPSSNVTPGGSPATVSPVTVSPLGGVEPSPVASADPSASPSSSPSPSPLPQEPPGPAYGVLVDLLSSTSTYTASLIGVTGAVAASVSANQRTPIAARSGHAITLPYVSTSSTALYYLSGDSIVQLLRPDGSQGAAANLNVGPGMEAAFAVSPDDSKIAFSVLDFNQTPVHLTLYTDNLVNTSARRVIFESSTDYVWPVAWHGGLLVLAHAVGPYEEDIAKDAPGRDNPYSAVSYHVVDPQNANRIVLMGSCTVSGALSPAGSGCIQGGAIDWQGNTAPWSTNDWGAISSAAALSPDGKWMAATPPDNPKVMAIYSTTGNIWTYMDGPGVHDWAGWLDDQTIMTGSYINSTWQPQVANVIKGGVVHPIAAHGFYAGRLPTDVV